MPLQLFLKVRGVTGCPRRQGVSENVGVITVEAGERLFPT